MGDYRDLDRCAPARLLAALDLAADPANALAWRSWCGFGDYLANSAAFADMRAGAAAEARASWRCWRRRRPPRPPRASRTRASAASWTPTAPGASSSPRCRAWKVTGCWTPSRPASAWKATGRRGRGPSSVPSRPRPRREGGTDAATLSRRARRALGGAAFGDTAGRVLVGAPEHLVGRSPAVLVLAGFVNGFFPSRDYFDATVMTPDKQKLARATDIRRLYAAAGKPTERLVASWFTSIDLVGAEQLKLEIGRVRLRRGERIATTSPSIYLKEIEPTEDQSA
ncbi:MAG: hypothetical protein ACLSDQ_00085 [Adlercreutzia equolifaciens]